MKKFNIQICTTIEQSQHLLDLGLKPETADMYYFWLGGNDYRLKVDDNNPLKYNMDKTYIPAWSLHKLLYITFSGDINQMCNININCYTIENIFNELTKLITWCIEDDGFSKEYLN